MEISAATVKALRDKTGAGMMDCKKALQESDGDMDQAIDYLRKKGAATADKRSDRSTNEGAVMTKVENGMGIILEIDCETDFVARSEDFLGFGNALINVIAAKKPADTEALLAESHDGISVKDLMNDVVGKIGEKIEVKRFATFETDGVLIDYIHPGSKLGVMVELKAPQGAEDAVNLGKDLAMQIAAMNPVAITRDEVSQETQDRELNIYRQQAIEQGKPEKLVDRIAEGKLNKYFTEYTLMEQSFIRDNTKTVKEHLAEVAKGVGSDINISRFERFQIGEDN
jgi:elongation factor Ts